VGKRRRHIGFGIAAEETVIGAWEWDLDGMRWRFDSAMRGINVSVRLGEEWHPMVHCLSLKEAGMFSEGVHAGMTLARYRALANGK